MSANLSSDSALSLPVGHPLRVAAERRLQIERSKPAPPARAQLDAAFARAKARTLPTAPRGAPWQRGKFSNAKPGTCTLGHEHPSGLEARVCGKVHELAASLALPSPILYARWPLLAGGTDARGRCLFFAPDFTLWKPGAPPSIVRVLDAKGRTSPEWRRGAQMFYASYGVRVEEITHERDVCRAPAPTLFGGAP